MYDIVDDDINVDGKSPLFVAKSTISMSYFHLFSILMLVYQRVPTTVVFPRPSTEKNSFQKKTLNISDHFGS
jgi:hypothetical protein